MADLSDEQWALIDVGILERDILTTIKRIREATGLSLKESIELYHSRYRMLRERRPGEFECDDRSYWEGFYS